MLLSNTQSGVIMFQLKNIVVGLVLYSLIIVIDSQNVVQQCPSTPNFKCDRNNLTFVTLGGITLKCLNDEICNINNFHPCTPCIKCVDQHQCTINENHVIMQNNTYECPKYHICNNNPTPGNCDPCVEAKCEPAYYQCLPNNPSTVIIGQMQLSCKRGSICNKNNKQPCSPCIENIRSLLLLEDKTVPETYTTFVVPDCNDGLSRRMPCRPGPAGSDYYFRCKKRWCWYEQEMMHCSQQLSDNLCLRDFNICIKP